MLKPDRCLWHQPPPLHTHLHFISPYPCCPVRTSEFQSSSACGEARPWPCPPVQLDNLDSDHHSAFETHINPDPVSHITTWSPKSPCSLDGPSQAQPALQSKILLVISDPWFLWPGCRSLQLNGWSCLETSILQALNLKCDWGSTMLVRGKKCLKNGIDG